MLHVCVCKHAWDTSCNCPSNEYRPVGDLKGCMPWTTCSAETRVSTPGSNTTDRLCTPCEHGTFTNISNLHRCFNWTKCESYIVNGNTTTDRKCGAGTTTSPATTTSLSTTSTTTGVPTTKLRISVHEDEIDAAGTSVPDLFPFLQLLIALLYL